jgi:O-antigen/teichoic acid export membrane protein
VSLLSDPLGFIKNRFLRDTATLQVSGILNQGSQLLSSIAVAYLLGAHGQGVFVAAVMLQGLFYNFVHMGVVPATVSMVAAASARDMRDKLTIWLGFLVKSYAMVSVIMVVGGYFLLPWVSELFFARIGSQLSVEEARRLGWWAWVLTLWIPIDTPRAVAQVAFHATRRMLPLGQLDNGQEVMRMYLVICGAVITGDAGGAVLGEVASRILASALSMQMYHRARLDGGAWLPTAGQILRRTPAMPLLKGMRLGIRVGVIKSSAAIITVIAPRLLLGAFAGMAWAAYLNVAQRLVGIIQMLMQGVSRTILPALSVKSSHRDLDGFRRLYWRTTLFTGLGLSAVWLAMLPTFPFVVGILWPQDYAQPVFVCCVILTFGIIPLSFAVAQDAFYILVDRMKANLLICFAGALVTIPANVFLVHFLPTTGPVWALTVYMAWVLIHFVYIVHYFRTQRAGQGFWEPRGAAQAPPAAS